MGNFYMIPVPMIKRLFLTPDAYNELLHVGSYYSAQKVSNYTDEDMVRHLAYCWFRQKDELTPNLVKAIQNWNSEGELEDDYALFNTDGTLNDEEAYFIDDSNFEGVENPEEPCTPLGMLADACRQDNRLWSIARAWHDVYMFDQTCNMKILGSIIEATINTGRKYYSICLNQPYALIDPYYLIQYREKNKSERSRAELAMLLAIGSIQGKAGWSATTRNLIIARMFGAKTHDGLSDVLKGSTKEGQQLREAFEKYTTRRVFDSMRNNLINKGVIKCWAPYSHRVIVSTAHKLEEIENDVMIFLKRKQSPKEQIKHDADRLKELINGS